MEGWGVLFARSFLPVSFDVDEIVPGVLLKVTAQYEKVKLVFLNVYAPTNGVDRVAFLNILSDAIEACGDDSMFLGGILTVRWIQP